VNNLIPPPKDLGVLLTVLEVEGDSLIGSSIEGSSEEFQGVHGYSKIRRFKEHQIQRLFEVWGSVYIGVEELGLISRNSCKHVLINICYLVDDLGEGVLHQEE
jgi:hypothetical protein